MSGEPALQWFSHLGCGFLPPTREAKQIYTRDYYEKYVEYETNSLSAELLLARLATVRRWHAPGGGLLDVGCGSGAFVRFARAAGLQAFGADVMPDALDALGPWADRTAPMQHYGTLTFWDSIEHIAEPYPWLDCAARCVIAAIPVFRDRDDVLASKHYRPDEHLWYFTRLGFIDYMASAGFELVELHDAETRVGREAIATFSFLRTDNSRPVSAAP